MVSITLGLFKDSLGFAFFAEIFSTFVLSVIFWAIANLVNGGSEYWIKLAAWHFLIYDLVLSFVRMASNQLEINAIVGLFVLFGIIAPTYLIWKWLQKVGSISEESFVGRKIWFILGIWTVFQLVGTVSAY